MILRLLIFILILSTAGCNQIDSESKDFENKLFKKIKESGKEFIDTKEKKVIDLKEVTNFEWDKFKYVAGNESVDVLKNEIECYLNLDFETEDLLLNKSRFYFFKNNKLVKELEINQINDLYFDFSNTCLNDNYYSSKFIVTTNSDNIKSSTITLNQVCYRNNYKEEQLIKYKDYTYIVSPMITKDNGKTYEYNVASKKIIDSIGMNTIFNKEIKSQDGETQISFDVIEDRVLSQNIFFKVINNRIIIKPDFYLNCYDKSNEKVIYHCEIGFKQSDIKMTDIEI